MSKSSYTYKVEQFAGRNCIFIVDTGASGKMSVTNNIENVIAEISGKEHIDPAHFMIVYSDSRQRWDGWDHINNKFEILNATNAYHAVNRWIKQQLSSPPIIHHNTEHMKKTNDPEDTQEDDDDNEGTGALVD